MSNEQLAPYAIMWETKRSSGTIYYSGARRVFAQNAEHAKERARSELASYLGLSPESIEILEVRRL